MYASFDREPHLTMPVSLVSPKATTSPGERRLSVVMQRPSALMSHVSPASESLISPVAVPSLIWKFMRDTQGFLSCLLRSSLIIYDSFKDLRCGAGHINMVVLGPFNLQVAAQQSHRYAFVRQSLEH